MIGLILKPSHKTGEIYCIFYQAKYCNSQSKHGYILYNAFEQYLKFCNPLDVIDAKLVLQDYKTLVTLEQINYYTS